MQPLSSNYKGGLISKNLYIKKFHQGLSPISNHKYKHKSNFDLGLAPNSVWNEKAVFSSRHNSTPSHIMEKRQGTMNNRAYNLPQMFKIDKYKSLNRRDFNSLDWIKTGASSALIEEESKYKLPSIKNSCFISEKAQFLFSDIKNKNRPNSLLRNSTSQNPFGSIAPLQITPKGEKLIQLKDFSPLQNLNSEKKMRTINSPKNFENQNQENVQQNGIEAIPNFNNGFNATFSKIGSIPGIEKPLDKKLSKRDQVAHQEIEIKQLEDSSDEESEINKSKTEFSQNKDIRSKFSRDQSLANYSEISSPINLNKINFSDNEATKKAGKKLKIRK